MFEYAANSVYRRPLNNRTLLRDPINEGKNICTRYSAENMF